MDPLPPPLATPMVKTQTKVEKGQKMGRADASPTGAEYFQRYFCSSVSVCIGIWAKRKMANIKNELSNLLWKIIHKIVIFS